MRHRRRHIARLSAAALVAVAGLAAGTAPTPDAVAAPGTGVTPEAVREITLVTGDLVRYRARGDSAPHVQVTPGPGRQDRRFTQYVSKRHAYVLPDDAARLVARGVVDRRLFDVTALARSAPRDATPVIVRYAPTAVRTLAATRTYRHQPMSAVRVASPDSATFWRRSTAPGGGIEKIWLDGTAKLSLDRSVPHIGGAAAWQRGLKGSGVRVAVLDTGYDATHPDLAGAVVASRNFTPDPAGVRDTIGHGTHVASIVAGRTAPYTGVAPEASLLVGKVCSDVTPAEGECRESDILAGMEWAAEQGARVVNLSLGSGPTDGTDPLSSAVETLTAAFGTLFVASAGNHFPWDSGDAMVGAPAAANSALAVASTTLDDTLSDFSNKGPRRGDHAIKPDLAAPGDGIVAAHAADGWLGEPVDDDHARMSGTSMAAPHVAGAAAILAQQHPTWRAAELKAALMSTSRGLDESVYSIGAGRLDLARATGQPAWASPGSLSLGYFRWPNAGAPPVTRQITYHNDGAAPLTLSLELSTGDAPAGFFTLGATTVTVPAGGTATVAVTATIQPGRPGRYGGHVLARSGDTVVRTAIGAYQEAESFTLDLRTVDRTGHAPSGEFETTGYVLNTATGELILPSFTNGVASLRLPRGRYAVWLGITTPPTPADGPSITLAMEPGVDLGRDVSLSFDARAAKLATATVDRPGAEPVGAQTIGAYQPIAGELRYISASVTFERALYALPTRTVDGFGFFNSLTMAEPEIRMAAAVAAPPGLFTVPVRYLETTYSPRIVGDELRGVVDGGAGTPAELSRVDARGRLVLLTLASREDFDAFTERVANVVAAGGRAIMLTTWEGPRLEGPLPLPVLQAHGVAVERLRAGARAGGALAWLHGIAGSPYQYGLVLETKGRIPQSLNYRVRDAQLARVDTAYAAQGVGRALGTLYQTPELPVSLWTAPSRMVIGASRPEYFTTGPVPGTAEPLYWHQELRHEASDNGSLPWGGPQSGRRGPFQRPGRTAEWWNFGPIQPCLDLTTGTSPPVAFAGDRGLIVDLPLFCDSAPGHSGHGQSFGDEHGDTGSTVVLRDGAEVGRVDEPGFTLIEVPAGAGRYEIRSAAGRSQPWTRLTPRSSATWQFAWSGVQGEAPLLDVRMRTPVDLDNRAPAGDARLDVEVAHATGGTATAVGVDVSYDDGTTWQATALHRQGNGWYTTLRHPTGGGYVSLRATARDAAGNSVKEEVIRAYALR